MSSNKKLDKNLDINNFNNIIKGSNTLLKLFSCLVIIVIICILIGHYAFKNGILTCDHYVFNTYLYIILAILLTFMVVLINDQTGIFNSLILWLVEGAQVRVIVTFIIIIILLFWLMYELYKVDPQNIVASNAIWFTLIFILGFFLIPTIWFGRLNDVVGLAGILTIFITVVVGILGYYYGDNIVTFDWDKYLNYALWVLIILIIAGMFFIRDIKNLSTFYFVISIISLLIFVLLLLSNHKKLKENSEKCIDGKVVPNYPVESFSLFIRMLNIFSDLIRILGRLKGRKGKR
jgi:FtsH-binding integral membrane protein